MILMYSDPDRTKAMTAEERDLIRRKHEALGAKESEALLNGAGLAYPEATTTIQLGDGDAPITTRGPFMPGRQQLTAYYVVECDSPERAAAIAAEILDFHVTAVEVRAIHDSFGMAAGGYS
jgi:hypothetical protein